MGTLYRSLGYNAEMAIEHNPVVLLTGASGYVGGRLIPLLEQQPVKLRCLARHPEKLRSQVKETTEVVQGDVLDADSLEKAMQGVHTAYYLVHLMSGSKDFEKDDRQAAKNFAEAAKKAQVSRIIYLGGLGDDADPKLSPHLRSRHEVGKILRESGVETIEFRASLVIGAGSLSFESAEVVDQPIAHHDLPPLAVRLQRSPSPWTTCWPTSWLRRIYPQARAESSRLAAQMWSATAA